MLELLHWYPAFNFISVQFFCRYDNRILHLKPPHFQWMSYLSYISRPFLYKPIIGLIWFHQLWLHFRWWEEWWPRGGGTSIKISRNREINKQSFSNLHPRTFSLALGVQACSTVQTDSWHFRLLTGGRLNWKTATWNVSAANKCWIYWWAKLPLQNLSRMLTLRFWLCIYRPIYTNVYACVYQITIWLIGSELFNGIYFPMHAKIAHAWFVILRNMFTIR